MSRIVPSPTLAITSKARALAADGLDVVSFAAGEPDFNTPEPIIEAATRAMRDGKTKYTACTGIPELREAIAHKFLTQNHINTRASEIVVSCGAKHCLYNALMVLLEPGDEVIIFAPYWMTYAEQVKLAGGVPVVVPCLKDFRPDLDHIPVSARTKVVILNSPCNPSGVVWTDEEFRKLVALAEQHNLIIIADEIYEHLTYGVAHKSIAAMDERLADHVITINGVSKAFAMTGWRIGYMTAPLKIAQAISTLQDQVTSNASSISQNAALAALNLPLDSVVEMRNEFDSRRKLMLERVNQIPGVQCAMPDGAFYALITIENHLSPGQSDSELAERLLSQVQVATIPGSVFEAPGHLRLTYAESRERIEEGISRMSQFFAENQR